MMGLFPEEPLSGKGGLVRNGQLLSKLFVHMT